MSQNPRGDSKVIIQKYMKYLLPILIIVLVGCSQPYNYEFGSSIPDLGLETTQEVMTWVSTNIHYESDQLMFDRLDEWQLPHQTYIWRTGDCEDFAILAMYLLRQEVGVESLFETGEGPYGAHAWISIDGVDWSPQEGKPEPKLIEAFPNHRTTRTYDEVISMASRRSVYE